MLHIKSLKYRKQTFIMCLLFVLSSITSFGQGFITTWKTDNSGVTADDAIEIPTTGSGYNYTVDWGDGTIESGFTANALHTYATSGTYTVEITGDFPRIYFDDTGDKDKILSIEQWGNIEWADMSDAFFGCSNLVANFTDAPDMSGVTDMSRLFKGCASFNTDLNDWDVSSITNMTGVFFDATNFNGQIDGWTTSSLVNTTNMFNNATSFNQDISGWNMSSVTSMLGMFSDTNFNQDLSNWNVSNVTDMSFMFFNAGLSTANYDATLIGWNNLPLLQNGVNFGAGTSQYCTSRHARQNIINTHGWIITDGGPESIVCDTTAFISIWKTDNPGTSNDNQINIPGIGSYNISWEKTDDITINGTATGNGTTTITFPSPGTYRVGITGNLERIFFNNSGDSRKLIDITQWGTIAWTNMERAFEGCINLNINALDAPDLSGVTNTSRMFQNTGLLGEVNHWDVSTIINMAQMFQESNFNVDISSWNVGNVTNMSSMFSGTTIFNQNIGNWDVSSVTTMIEMFGESSFNQDLSTWDISNVTNMTNMFDNAGLSTANYDATLIGWNNLPSLQNGVNFNAGTSQYCVSQQARQNIINNYGWSITDGGPENINCDSTAFISIWQTDNNGTSNDNQITIPGIGNYNISWERVDDISVKGTTTASGTTTLTFPSPGTYRIGITGNLERIFFNTSEDSRKIIDVSQWGTIAWTSMERAFKGCLNLSVTADDAPDLSGVTNLSFMFSESNSQLSLNHWDVSTIMNMKQMFVNSTFNSDLSSWDVSNVINMSGMFIDAQFNQDISNWDVSNVTNMNFVFSASNFNQNISSWDISSVTTMIEMFGDSSFNQSLANWDISNVTNLTDMFFGAGLSTANYDATLIGWNNLPSLQNGVNFGAGTSQYCASEQARQNLINTHGWTITDGNQDVNCGVVIAPKVFLQGASVNPNTGEETLMRDDLRVAGLLPTTSPYQDGATCLTTVFDTTGTDAIVDWIWLELRDATDSTIIIDGQSTLLQRDGDIVSTDGITEIEFNRLANNFYLVIKHRNHLGVMTAAADSFSPTTKIIDFTDANNQITFGSNAQTTFGLPTDLVGMWAGNVNNDNQIRYQGSGNDTNSIKDNVINNSGNTAGSNLFSYADYDNADINMNGTVRYQGSGNDSNMLKDIVLSHPNNNASSNLFLVIGQLQE